MRRTMIVGGLVVAVLAVVVVWYIVRNGSGSIGVVAADRGAGSSPPGTELGGTGSLLPDTTASAPTNASNMEGLSHPDGRRRAFDRVRADGIRQRAAAVSSMPEAKAIASASGRANAAIALAPPLRKPDREELTQEEKARRRQYVQDAVREQYFPIARSCYEELLSRKPSSAGKIVMSFSIVSDGEDGVVDRVEVGAGTTMNDPEFILCMRESMYSTIFEPPPPGASETTIEYPIELSP